MPRSLVEGHVAQRDFEERHGDLPASHMRRRPHEEEDRGAQDMAEPLAQRLNDEQRVPPTGRFWYP
jgi:hypothetical protein